MLTIASWNINSVRLRFNLVVRLIEQLNPNIICLQETKVEEYLFPDFSDYGYKYNLIAGQKSYNGVAILSRAEFSNPEKIHIYNQDARALKININGYNLYNCYVPAGGDEADININPKFAHKVAYMENLIQLFEDQNANNILVGDINIAPLENDVWSHKQLLKVVSHTPIEVELFNQLLNKGKFIDAPRLKIDETEKLYSWWSYRNRDYKKSNRGRRLDHALISANIANNILDAYYLHDYRDYEMPSDHVPLILKLK